MRSQFIDRRTRSERAVVVEVSERGGHHRGANVNAVEGVRASGPLHESRHRRRPEVLEVDERIGVRVVIGICINVAKHYEV